MNGRPSVKASGTSPSPYRVFVPAALADYAAAGGLFEFESARSEQIPLEIRFSLRDPELYDRLLLERMTTIDSGLQRPVV